MVSCALYNFENREVRIDLPDWPKKVSVKIISGDEVVDFYFLHFNPIHIDTSILNRRLDDADIDLEYELHNADEIIRFVEFSRNKQDVMDELAKDKYMTLSEYRACKVW